MQNRRSFKPWTQARAGQRRWLSEHALSKSTSGLLHRPSPHLSQGRATPISYFQGNVCLRTLRSSLGGVIANWWVPWQIKACRIGSRGDSERRALRSLGSHSCNTQLLSSGHVLCEERRSKQQTWFLQREHRGAGGEPVLGSCHAICDPSDTDAPQCTHMPLFTPFQHQLGNVTHLGQENLINYCRQICIM